MPTPLLRPKQWHGPWKLNLQCAYKGQRKPGLVHPASTQDKVVIGCWERLGYLCHIAGWLRLLQSLGGRFNSLMPSDLSKPGAFGFESVPAKAENSQDYASSAVKRELSRMFSRNGCHHCGEEAGCWLMGCSLNPAACYRAGKHVDSEPDGEHQFLNNISSGLNMCCGSML